ncbi:hypothetical protein WG66_012424 [Moniliophthora roreri]|nr:hypothetical protein WG66_012424 [Moniliophthora roreri]
MLGDVQSGRSRFRPWRSDEPAYTTPFIFPKSVERTLHTIHMILPLDILWSVAVMRQQHLL